MKYAVFIELGGEMVNENRVEYFDLYRGFAIVLMVMGHVGYGTVFDHYIHAFHMPMWFFISGYFFKDRRNSFAEYIIYRAKKLLIPYSFFAAVYYLIIVLTVDTSRGLIHLDLIKKYVLFNHDGLPISGVFWFVTCLLVADVLFLWLRRMVSNDKLFALSTLIISCLGIIISKHISFRFIWTSDTAFVSLLFYYLGYAMKNTKMGIEVYRRFLNTGIGWILLLLVLNAYVIMKTSYVNLRTATYPNVILFYVNAVCGTMVWLKLCYDCDFYDARLWSVLKRGLCYVGEHTMGYLFLNQLMIKYIKLILPGSGMIEKMLILMICMLIITVLTQLIMKTPFKLLIGK